MTTTICQYRSIFFIGPRLISTLCIAWFATMLHAQTPDKPMVDMPTPTTANFELHTKIPISQYTGMPGIGIPLYEIKEGDIRIPISLNYHLGSVRVHNHPGWVGLGWSLMAGGAITRQLNGQLDEFQWKFIPSGHSTYTATGFLGSFSQLAGTDADWNSTTKLNQLRDGYTFTQGPRFEAMPDEFSFNFLGYSGSFFMGHDGLWKVVSDQDIMVEFDQTLGIGLIEENQLPAHILDRMNDYGSANNDRINWSKRYFSKFTLITPDGNRFEFGGPQATEYTVAYLQTGGPIPVTFHLTKITSPTGHEITFNYEPGNIISSVTSKFWYSNVVRDKKRGSLEIGCDVTLSQDLYETNYDGALMFPMYLKSINYSSGTVFFDRQESTELTWPTNGQVDGDFLESSSTKRGEGIYFKKLFQAPENLTSFGAQRKWFKLSKIRIEDYRYPTYPLVKIFDFNYTNDAQTRLKLLSLQESTQVSGTLAVNPPYIFSYNQRALPSYSEVRSNDHWDFYNGLNPVSFIAGGGNLETQIQKYYEAREPDPTGEYLKAETLIQMHYPTGGSVKFDYEPHQYSKYVDRENPTFPVIENSSNKPLGGLRIRRISHFSENDDVVPSMIKEYFYLKDFALNSDLDGLRSSGILGGLPKYYWPNYTGKDIVGSTFHYTIFSSGSVLPFGFNVPGSHIGYSEVTEVSRNLTSGTSGYTKFKFTNFDTDIWGQSHPDEVGVTIDPDRSVYSPLSTKEYKRGKLLAEEQYDNANQPVSISKYQYTETYHGFVRRALQERFSEGCETAGAQTVFVTAFKTYLNRYQLVQKHTIVYDKSQTFTTINTNEYNSSKLLIRTTQTTSGSDVIEKSIRYPKDFTVLTALQSVDWEALGISKLLQKNIINTPIEVITKRNNLLIEANLVGYKVFGSNVFQHKKWVTESAELLPIGGTITKTTGLETNLFNPAGVYRDVGQNFLFRKDEHYTQPPFIINQYDTKGNPQEWMDENNVVSCTVWGYKSSLPVANIIGATYSQVVATGVNLTSIANDNLSDNSIRTMIATLRSGLPNATITGYTHGAFGITSKVDPNGMITYYEYDSRGRLITIKDHQGKVLEAHTYKYSSEN